MSITAAQGQSFEATLTGAPTGLVGTLGVQVTDGVGAVAVARTTAGIVESPAGSGVYTATITAPAAVGNYVITWDSGVVSPETTAVEDLTVTTGAAAWQPDYVTAAQLKSAVRILDTADDAELGFAISAASRAIDQHCGRQFGQLAAPEARYYRPRYDRKRGRWVVFIDDLMTTTGLVVESDSGGDGTFETALTLDSDVRLHPWNAAAEGRPWTMLAAGWSVQFVPGFSAFPDRQVRVTARFGWSAVPAVVVQACLIQASRLWKRKDAPFGVAGSPEMGSELRLLTSLDPDVTVLLDSVKRVWGVH